MKLKLGKNEGKGTRELEKEGKLETNIRVAWHKSKPCVEFFSLDEVFMLQIINTYQIAPPPTVSCWSSTDSYV